MKIASARLQRLGGRLPVAISNSGASWTTREGLLLQLFSEEGLSGQGEATPLPGYSRDTIEECEAALTALRPDDFGELDLVLPAAAQVRRWLAAHPLPPAARFAVETALFNLIALRTRRPVAELLGSPVSPHPVPLSALLPSPLRSDELLREAADALARGLRTLKIKIGRAGAFDDELAALRALRREVGSEVQLRLDANGAFPLAEASERLEALADLRPELIEEPVPLGQLAAFGERAESAIPLAADESLNVAALRPDLMQAFAHRRLAVAILKPTVLGGVLACLDLASELLPLDAKLMVTHAFEGPTALASAMALASVLPGPVLAAGLDRHPGLSQHGWKPG
jgi:o-succinylbenzoate synthase